jgi:hypothetical protein
VVTTWSPWWKKKEELKVGDHVATLQPGRRRGAKREKGERGRAVHRHSIMSAGVARGAPWWPVHPGPRDPRFRVLGLKRGVPGSRGVFNPILAPPGPGTPNPNLWSGNGPVPGPRGVFNPFRAFRVCSGVWRGKGYAPPLGGVFRVN